MRQVKSLVNLDGLLTKGNIYTVHHENKGYLTIYDDRGVSCVYSEVRFEAILAPQVAPNFSQMQQIADEVNNTLQPDESGIKCPVVESVNNMLLKNPLRQAHDRIAELEKENELLKKTFLSHQDDCYYWTPAAWQEFQDMKAELAVLKRGAP